MFNEPTLFERLGLALVDVTLGLLLAAIVKKLHPKKRGIFQKFLKLFKAMVWILVFILIGSGIILPFMTTQNPLSIIAVFLPIVSLPIMFAVIFIFLIFWGFAIIFFLRNFVAGITLIYGGVSFLVAEVSLLLILLCPENSNNCIYEKYNIKLTDLFFGNFDNVVKVGYVLAILNLFYFLYRRFKPENQP